MFEETKKSIYKSSQKLIKIKKFFVINDFFSKTCKASLREDVVNNLNLEDVTYSIESNKKLERLYRDNNGHIWSLNWNHIEQEYYLKFLEY